MGMLKVCFSVTRSMNIYIQRIYDTSLSIKHQSTVVSDIFAIQGPMYIHTRYSGLCM